MKRLFWVWAVVAALVLCAVGIWGAGTAQPRSTPLALLQGAPIFAGDAGDSVPSSDTAGASRMALGSDNLEETGRRAEPASAPDDAWAKAIERMRAIPSGPRGRWLKSHQAFLGSGQSGRFLDEIEGIDAPLERALRELEQESDPLIQAVLLRVVQVEHSRDSAYAALERATVNLAADSSRPVHSAIAARGWLHALDHRNLPPHGVFEVVGPVESQVDLCGELYAMLGSLQLSYQFPEVEDLLRSGFQHRHHAPRRGAFFALRSFSQRDALGAQERNDLLQSAIAAETHPTNQQHIVAYLAKLEDPGAQGLLRALVFDDPRQGVRLMAAAAMGLNREPEETLALFLEALDGDDEGGFEIALAAIESIPTDAGFSAIRDLYFQLGPDHPRRTAVLAALMSREGVCMDVFLDAGSSADAEVRSMVAQEFATRDRSQLSEAERLQLDGWLGSAMAHDEDPNVRLQAMFAHSIQVSDDPVASLAARAADDSSPTVRASAAALIYAMGWAQGRADLQEQGQSLLGAENGFVQDRVQGMLGFTMSEGPEYVAHELSQQLRFLKLASEQGNRPTHTKNPFRSQHQQLKSLQSMLFGGS